MYTLHPNYKHAFYGLIYTMDAVPSQLPGQPFEIGERVACYFVQYPIDPQLCKTVFCTVDSSVFKHSIISTPKLETIIKLNGTVKYGSNAYIDFACKLNIDL